MPHSWAAKQVLVCQAHRRVPALLRARASRKLRLHSKSHSSKQILSRNCPPPISGVQPGDPCLVQRSRLFSKVQLIRLGLIPAVFTASSNRFCRTSSLPATDTVPNAIVGQMDNFHANTYHFWGQQLTIGHALLFLFCALVILSFLVSFFCCAPRFGPREEDIEREPLLNSPP